MTKEGRDVRKTGTREQVFKGHAMQTSGGLTAKDLVLNQRGRYVSLRMSQKATELWKSGEGPISAFHARRLAQKMVNSSENVENEPPPQPPNTPVKTQNNM